MLCVIALSVLYFLPAQAEVILKYQYEIAYAVQPKTEHVDVSDSGLMRRTIYYHRDQKKEQTQPIKIDRGILKQIKKEVAKLEFEKAVNQGGPRCADAASTIYLAYKEGEPIELKMEAGCQTYLPESGQGKQLIKIMDKLREQLPNPLNKARR